MTIFILSAIACFAYVFLRALQQLNVVHNHYWRILPVSLLMGVGDAILILLIVKSDTIWIGLTNGIGGALGCYLAMWVNRRLTT
jgi:hypothetical protein